VTPPKIQSATISETMFASQARSRYMISNGPLVNH